MLCRVCLYYFDNWAEDIVQCNVLGALFITIEFFGGHINIHELSFTPKFIYFEINKIIKTNQYDRPSSAESYINWVY